MTIIGIDPGFGRMGYGVIEVNGGKLRALAFGCLETKKLSAFGDRLLFLKKELSALLNKYSPDRVGVEKLFFTKNAKTALQVGEARGVAILAIAEAGIPCVEVTPLQVKQALTGYGVAEKRQVQKMVQIILRLKDIPRPDDAADALAVALCVSQSVPLSSQERVG